MTAGADTWLRLPVSPPPTTPIPIDASTTPRRLVLRTIVASPRHSIPAAALMVLHQVGEALVPVIMGVAIDQAVATGDLGRLLWWLAVLAVDFAMLSTAYRMGSAIGLYGMQSVQHRLRMQVTDRILHPAGAGGPRRLPGVLLSIASSDVNRLASAVAIGMYPVGEAAAVLFAGALLLSISWPLGLVVLLGAPLMLVIMDRASGPLRRRSHHEQELAGAAAGSAADLVSGIQVLHGIRAEATAAGRYRTISRSALGATLRAKTAEGWYLGSMTASSGILICAVAVLAGCFAVNDQITVGELLAIVGVTQFVMSPLEAFAVNFGSIWASALASAERVLSLLGVPAPGTPDPGPDGPQPGAGTLSLRGVRTGALDGIDLDIPAGQCVAVVTDAATAASLVDLLAVTSRPEAGEVQLDHRPLHCYGLDTVRGALLVAPHAGHLFDATLRENVQVAAGSLDALTALHAVAADDIMASATGDPLDTEVGETGFRLSGGQRQRVALARAIATPALVVVLHDPTTAVDSVTESRIATRLRSVTAERTTVLLTTAPALLAVADRVVLIEDGRVLADSTHAALQQRVDQAGIRYRERIA